MDNPLKPIKKLANMHLYSTAIFTKESILQPFVNSMVPRSTDFITVYVLTLGVIFISMKSRKKLYFTMSMRTAKNTIYPPIEIQVFVAFSILFFIALPMLGAM